MSYFAELDIDNMVLRVVVADDLQWCIDNLGGTWMETANPYSEESQVVTYCGPGFGADIAVPERFALPWSMDAATIPNELGEYAYATQGQVVFHNGKIWRNLQPDGNPNVWEPPTNWREYPMGDEHPLWVQPVGAVDAYPLDFIVEHDGIVWKSLTPANVWEPPTEWEDMTPAPPIAEWVQPTGAHDAYNTGDRVIFETLTYESLIDGNVWSPSAYPTGWATIG